MLDLPNGLKRTRKVKKIMQKDIASFLNIPLRTYQSYEYGEALPSIETLAVLADYFNVSLDYLVGRSDDPERH